MLQIQAATRLKAAFLTEDEVRARYALEAAKADNDAASTFLTELGFKGLAFKSTGEDIIQFRYKSYDEAEVTKYLGQPKPAASSIRYDFGLHGVVAIWPTKKTVILKNSKRAALRVKPTETHVPHVEKDVPVVSPGSKENDDSHVPKTVISGDLAKMYEYAQKTDNKTFRLRLRFMHTLWKYLNQHKFGSDLVEPHMGLMKNVAGKSLRVRGRWWAGKRLLEVSPRLFNASQNFFLEVFMHEMCHQAVSEVDKVRDTNKGHGPVWAKWMKHVGLNPLRFDPNDNTTYITEDEKAEHQEEQDKRRAVREKNKQVIENRSMRHTYPANDKPASIIIDGHVLNGLIICPSVKNGIKWAFMPDSYAARVNSSFSNVSWKIAKPEHLYEYQGDNAEQYKNQTWQHLAAAIRGHYKHKQLKREFNNYGRSNLLG